MLKRSLLLVAFVACAAQAADARRPKKLIQTGWDHPDTERLRANLAEMERRPFDGVVVAAIGRKDDGRRCDLFPLFTAEKWKREWFLPCLADLKACKFTRFTDNFLVLGANPGNVDWFDDAGWAAVVDHWRIAAWLAREAGFKGLTFDPEPYTPPHNQFGYRDQPGRDKLPFSAYAAKARERGRQVMAAVAQEFPNIVLLCYFLGVFDATGHKDPTRALARHPYGLLPAFVDGWLDAAPPTVTIVDGCEEAYLYNSDEQYLTAAVRIKGDCQELISPENRAKYRAQVQVGFGVYLDAYWNPKEPKWMPYYIDGKGGSRIDRLKANVRTALRVADEYVWVYGEKFRWWPTPNKSVSEKTWPEALPGCDKVLRFARDPVDYARTQMAELAAAGRLVNLAVNPDFASDKATTDKGVELRWKEGRPPAGWAAWQAEKSKGTFTWDREVGATGKGSARAAGVANGCFLQGMPVKPGEHYAVRALRRLQGKGDAWVRVRWQTADEKWTAEPLDVVAYPDAPPDAWGEIVAVVEVPEGVGRLVVLLSVADQPTPDDVVWFDDVRVHKLD